MIIEKRLRSDAGSCNFHNGWKNWINKYGNTQTEWDHEEVYEMFDGGNGGIRVRICQQCLNELLTMTCLDKLTE